MDECIDKLFVKGVFFDGHKHGAYPPPHNYHIADYEIVNYGRDLASLVLKHSHSLIEREFSGKDLFSNVLELGSGTGIHAQFIRHKFDSYVMTDQSEDMLNIAKRKRFDDRFSFVVCSAEGLPFEDRTFDRVIACHVLEHIYKPNEALLEWDRVLKPGGILSLVQPCDPGMAWRLGRYFGPRRKSVQKGIPYDYMMAQGHVSAIFNIVTFIRHYFEQRSEIWWPLRVPCADVNLIYAVNIVKGHQSA